MKIICVVCLLSVIAFAKGTFDTVDPAADPESCDHEYPFETVDYPDDSCDEPVDPCAMFCTDIYEPICAFNDQCYKVFGNECEMNRHNCQNNGCYREVDLCYCRGQLYGECEMECSFT